MLTDKDTAAQVSALMLEFGSKLDSSIQSVQNSCSENKFKAYRSAIGKIMGLMLLDVMNPLYAQHPELKPRELN